VCATASIEVMLSNLLQGSSDLDYLIDRLKSSKYKESWIDWNLSIGDSGN